MWSENIRGQLVNAPTSEDLCVLTLVRKNQFYLLTPPISFIIDDHMRGALENGKHDIFHLPRGNHKCLFRYSYLSKQLDFELNGDVTIEIGLSRLTGLLSVNFYPV